MRIQKLRVPEERRCGRTGWAETTEDGRRKIKPGSANGDLIREDSGTPISEIHCYGFSFRGNTGNAKCK